MCAWGYGATNNDTKSLVTDGEGDSAGIVSGEKKLE